MEFRKQFLKGLRLLHPKNQLKLEGDWAYLQDDDAFEEFLKPLESKSWVTYIQPPPTESSQPADIVKYLARYLTGGPISDHRLVSYENGQVTFTARTGTTQGGSDEIEKVSLPVQEFVRRWCLHILPHASPRHAVTVALATVTASDTWTHVVNFNSRVAFRRRSNFLWWTPPRFHAAGRVRPAAMNWN